MEIAKGTLVDWMRNAGDPATAERAEAELPDRVDTERDAELLRRFHLDPQDVANLVGG
jgi:hypothetical protein